MNRSVIFLSLALASTAGWSATTRTERERDRQREPETISGVTDREYPIEFPSDFPTAPLVLLIRCQPHETVEVSIDGADLGTFSDQDTIQMMVPIGPRNVTHRTHARVFVVEGGQGRVIDRVSPPEVVPIDVAAGQEYTLRIPGAHDVPPEAVEGEGAEAPPITERRGPTRHHTGLQPTS